MALLCCMHSLCHLFFFSRWKMFELACVSSGSAADRICLVFPPKPEITSLPITAAAGSSDGMSGGLLYLEVAPLTPQVWLLDRSFNWHFLAPNFTTYFRMMLVHMGLPQWQLLFTPYGPTLWARVSDKFPCLT